MRPPRGLGDTQYTFGRYETMFRIGTGGMAEVFAARLCGEAGFERLAAIKRLLPHLAEDPQYVARFLDEGRLAARVVHPHVVQTLDLGRTDEGEPFLVLELIVGSCLDRLIRCESRPPLSVLLTWLSQSAEGLHAAHIARAPDGSPLGLVHRDVSPQNILVGLDGDARISDFGIAQAALLKTARTPTGQVTGKFAYFSPEQAHTRTLDARSDVFSLGIVAWEALTGLRLFEADSPAQIIDRVRSQEIIAPHKICPNIPADVSEVVLSALHRNPAARTQSAQAFARALNAVAKQLGDPASSSERSRWVRAVQDPMWQRLGTSSHLALTRATPAPARRSSKRLALSAASLLALASVLAWFSLQREPERMAGKVVPTASDGAAQPAPAGTGVAQRPASALPVAASTEAPASPVRSAPAAAPAPPSTARAVEPPSTALAAKQPSAALGSAQSAPPPRRRAGARAVRRVQHGAPLERRPTAAAPTTPPSDQARPALLGIDAFERHLQKPTTMTDKSGWGGRI
jgi:serine/threonine-protein kinase